MDQPPDSTQTCGDEESGWKSSSCLLDAPFAGNKKFVSVEYPGIVENVDKALETLGGCKSLSQTYNMVNKRISLRWRPKDPHCKPAYAERYNTSSLLLRVRKRWKKGDQSGETCEYKTEIVGVIGTTYKFQGMVDFQFLPMVKKEDGAYKNLHESVVVTKLCDRQEFLSKEVPLFIPPSSFSRTDFPDKAYAFRGSIVHRPGYKNPDSCRPANLIGTVRQKRTVNTKFCNFGESVPTGIDKEAIDELHSRYHNPEEEENLDKLFKDRPIWSRIALSYFYKGHVKKLKYILPIKAYYFLNGPWRCMWVRYGYDPSKDPKAKIYQTVDFRKRQGPVGEDTKLKLKRGENILHFPNMRRKSSGMVNINLKDIDTTEVKSESKLSKEEESFIYTVDTVPPCRQMFYQLCDVRVSKIQQYMHENDGKEERCDEKDGWCIPGTIEWVRDVMSYFTLKTLCKGRNITIQNVINKRKKSAREVKRIKALSNDMYDFVEDSDNEASGTADDSVLEEGDEEDEGEGVGIEEEDDVNEMETEMLDCV